jgi:hypothetical protein
MIKMMSATQRQESSMVNTFLMLLHNKVDKIYCFAAHLFRENPQKIPVMEKNRENSPSPPVQRCDFRWHCGSKYFL